MSLPDSEASDHNNLIFQVFEHSGSVFSVSLLNPENVVEN